MPSPRRHRSNRHPLYPEPGGWLLSDLPGMPKVKEPEPLPHRKLEAAEVRDYVAYEGLGFCVYEYLSSGKIADEQLAALWDKASVALRDIVGYLETVHGESRIRKVQPNLPCEQTMSEEVFEFGEDTDGEITI